MSEDTRTDIRAIVDYFYGGKATGRMTEIKALTDTDKKQLGDAIRSGSLTY